MRGSSYIPFPDFIKKKNAIINIQNQRYKMFPMVCTEISSSSLYNIEMRVSERRSTPLHIWSGITK